MDDIKYKTMAAFQNWCPSDSFWHCEYRGIRCCAKDDGTWIAWTGTGRTYSWSTGGTERLLEAKANCLKSVDEVLDKVC